MNQILGNILDSNYIKKSNSNVFKDFSNSNNLYILNRKFKIILSISILLIIFLIIFYFSLKYNAHKKEKLSKSLASNFNIQNLYTTNSDYSAKKGSTLSNQNNIEPFVVGLLKIDAIDLMYPILSSVSDELLEISLCRFYGPMPNEVGNLCIAGHNYINQKHFGKLSSLNVGDVIEVFDLNSNKVDYTVYKKLEVNANDTSCTFQNTNGIREVTLITCNTFKGTRIVVKAKQK